MSDRADHLTPPMQEHLARQAMAFVSTSDAGGRPRASLHSGPAGFAGVLDERTVMLPAYADAGLDHLAENPHIALLFADARDGAVALHISGRARVIDHGAVEAFAPLLRRLSGFGELEDVIAAQPRPPERWLLVDVAEARLDAPPVVAVAVEETVEDAPPPAPATPADPADELSYLLPPAWQTA